VIETHDNAVLINQKIKSDLIKVQQALLKLEIEGHGFNREMLKSRLAGYDDTNVYEFWEKTLEQRKSNLAPESIRIYMSDLRKLKEFRKSLSFNEITLEFLESLEGWCRARGNKDNTIHKIMKDLCYMVNRAKIVLGITNNAFVHYKKPYEETMREVFNLAFLDKILDSLYSNRFIETSVNEVLATFCLQALTGLRFGDASKFNPHTFISEDRILIKTEKTGHTVYVPIFGRLKDLLEFKNYQFNPPSNQASNRILKGIGVALDAPCKLTTHIAVHSFCTICLELGIPMEVISKIRGHRNIKTTQIYARVQNGLIEREMLKWQKSS
jgi:integrase